MAKTVDITEKLAFDENPRLLIAGTELEVNADAEAILRLMGVFSKGEDLNSINEALHIIFSDKDLKKLQAIKKDGKKLSASSLVEIINEATNLVLGDEDSGEH